MKKISHTFYRPHGANKVISSNELILQMHKSQQMETRAWTAIAIAASLLLMLSFFW